MNPLKREFLKLAEISGWNQAEIARRLELTRGGVHGLIKGDTKPSKALVRLFHLVLLAEKPEVIGKSLGAPGEAREPSTQRVQFDSTAYSDLISKLSELEEEDRDELLKHFEGLADFASKKSKPKKS